MPHISAAEVIKVAAIVIVVGGAIRLAAYKWPNSTPLQALTAIW